MANRGSSQSKGKTVIVDFPLKTKDGLKYGPDARCGTEAGYRAHSRRPGDESCPACRAAWSKRSRNKRDTDRDAHRKREREAMWKRNHGGQDRPPGAEKKWRDVQKRRKSNGTVYNHPNKGTTKGPSNKDTYKGPKRRRFVVSGGANVPKSMSMIK